MDDPRDDRFSLTAWRRRDEHELNRLGVTRGQARAYGWSAMLLPAWLVLKALALVVALIGGHWTYLALLLATWIPPRRLRGYIVVAYLIDVAVFAAGVALGLRALAVLGVLAPELLRLATVVTFGNRLGIGRVPSLIRIEWPQRTRDERRAAVRERKLATWRARISRARADRRTIERALFDMRDWWLTPGQAASVACGAGAARALVDEIVEEVILWPKLDDARHLAASAAWGRMLAADDLEHVTAEERG